MPQVDLAEIDPQWNAAGDRVALETGASDSQGEPLTSDRFRTAGRGFANRSEYRSHLRHDHPDAGQAEPYEVTVTATSSSGYSASQHSIGMCRRCMCSRCPTRVAWSAAVSPVQVKVSDFTGNGPLLYRADGLPPGLNIDPNTGVISGVVGAGADREQPVFCHRIG